MYSLANTMEPQLGVLSIKLVIVKKETSERRVPPSMFTNPVVPTMNAGPVLIGPDLQYPLSIGLSYHNGSSLVCKYRNTGNK